MPRLLIAAIGAVMLMLFLGPRVIRWLRDHEVGQFIRPRGEIPEGHAEKQGTPTMGGLLILFAMTVPFLILSNHSTASMLVLFTTLACGAIGFVDDWMKIVKKRSLGLSGRWKMLALVVISILLAVVAVKVVGVPTTIDFHVVSYSLEIGPIAFGVVVFLVLAGATNAVNLTDGLDGLAAGTMAIALLAYVGMTFVVTGQRDMAILAACLMGACVGFLWFNSYPAEVFMGDTGSLALGGALAGFAIFTKTELLLPLIGGIFVIEAASVIIQVISFRRFGRRVFLMAPIHHHFEMKAWSETKIMFRFLIIASIFASIAFVLYYVRFNQYS